MFSYFSLFHQILCYGQFLLYVGANVVIYDYWEDVKGYVNGEICLSLEW